jgi:CRP-like cAMP-binding protein
MPGTWQTPLKLLGKKHPMSVPVLPQQLDGNKVLKALSPKTRDAFVSKLQMVALAAGQVLYEPGDLVHTVYFPISAVISKMNVMEDGESVAVAVVGNEGMVGVQVFWGRTNALARTATLLPGEAFRMATEALLEELITNNVLRSQLHRYANALLTQIFQSAGCNRLHSVQKRCARWLLMIQDRARADEYALTQELLSQILGVRRQSIGVVADSLQKSGLIRYSRGKISIRNRKGLEAASCECYRRGKEEIDRLLG